MKLKLFYSAVFLMLFNTGAYAAFVGLPVPVEHSITGTLEVLDPASGPFGAVDVNFKSPISGDFDFMFLGEMGTGYDSSFFTSPGTYTFNSTPDSVFPDAVTLSMTLGEDQVGMRTFIDWNGNTYDILSVWDVTTVGDTTTLLATDMDGDGVRGYQMVSGPFAGMNVAIDATIVTPIPAAAWLFGSGLLGLVGFARRKQTK
jgi:hypothetical protein